MKKLLFLLTFALSLNLNAQEIKSLYLNTTGEITIQRGYSYKLLFDNYVDYTYKIGGSNCTLSKKEGLWICSPGKGEELVITLFIESKEGEHREVRYTFPIKD